MSGHGMHLKVYYATDDKIVHQTNQRELKPKAAFTKYIRKMCSQKSTDYFAGQVAVFLLVNERQVIDEI